MKNTNYMQKMFDKLDEDNDGLVSLNELKSLLDKVGICIETESLLHLLPDGKSMLDFIDFFFLYNSIIDKENHKVVPEGEEDDDDEELVKVFNVFDLDGDGFISCEELKKVLLRLGLLEDGVDCMSMIKVYDTNLDGMLDFDEFKNMMSLSQS